MAYSAEVRVPESAPSRGFEGYLAACRERRHLRGPLSLSDLPLSQDARDDVLLNPT